MYIYHMDYVDPSTLEIVYLRLMQTNKMRYNVVRIAVAAAETDHIITKTTEVVDAGLPRSGGVNPREGATLIWWIFPKNYMKMNWVGFVS